MIKDGGLTISLDSNTWSCFRNTEATAVARGCTWQTARELLASDVIDYAILSSQQIAWMERKDDMIVISIDITKEEGGAS